MFDQATDRNLTVLLRLRYEYIKYSSPKSPDLCALGSLSTSYIMKTNPRPQNPDRLKQPVFGLLYIA